MAWNHEAYQARHVAPVVHCGMGHMALNLGDAIPRVFSAVQFSVSERYERCTFCSGESQRERS